ncbi:hypothetical protein GH714_008724 [Hevea brasiliensis]|uniref:V-type proton ATPase subunit F n=1 Tax=Hevea brasiliensis TaxID=3981 RepID=A0A6A6L1W1_HEVBR|nr:hypothetical protein GH714_008724 [Hevea brasiliensis]
MANRAQIPTSNSALIAMIADEDSVVGFLLAGVGNVDLRRKSNYLLVDSSCKYDRFLVDSYNKPVPAILEIPSKDHPYDPAQDSVLSRVKHLYSAESVASGRR